MPVTGPLLPVAPPVALLPFLRELTERLPGVPDPRDSLTAGWDDLKRQVMTVQASVMWGALAIVLLALGIVLVSGVLGKASRVVVSVAGSAGKAVKTRGASVAADAVKGATNG